MVMLKVPKSVCILTFSKFSSFFHGKNFWHWESSRGKFCSKTVLPIQLLIILDYSSYENHRQICVKRSEYVIFCFAEIIHFKLGRIWRIDFSPICFARREARESLICKEPSRSNSVFTLVNWLFFYRVYLKLHRIMRIAFLLYENR